MEKRPPTVIKDHINGVNENLFFQRAEARKPRLLENSLSNAIVLKTSFQVALHARLRITYSFLYLFALLSIVL